MLSFSTPSWLHNDKTEYYYDEKKPRKVSKFIRALKSCFGHGFDADTPSRKDYQRSRGAATGFEGEEVYGVQAEYLDEDDMAWGKPKKTSKRDKGRRQQRRSGEDHERACW